jgi:hypothetical protein
MGKKSKLTPTGHLTILKIYKDGTEETVWDDHNVITSGMGVALSHLFSASGSEDIEGFQIGDGGAVVISRSAIENGSLGVAKDFVSIRYSNIHRLSKTAVRFTLVLDDQTANIQDELTEVGLFMNNPQGLVPASPILVAYRPFAGIKKTDAFSLIFLWTIQF